MDMTETDGLGDTTVKAGRFCKLGSGQHEHILPHLATIAKESQ